MTFSGFCCRLKGRWWLNSPSPHPTSTPSNKRVLWKDLNLGTDEFYIQTARETAKLKGQYTR